MAPLARGRAWGEAYRSRERTPEMGEAHAFAREVFAAVEAIIVAGGKGTPHLDALAGALAEYRARETTRAKEAAATEAKAQLRAALDAAKRALDGHSRCI